MFNAFTEFWPPRLHDLNRPSRKLSQTQDKKPDISESQSAALVLIRKLKSKLADRNSSVFFHVLPSSCHTVFHGNLQPDVRTHLYFYSESALQLVMTGGSLKCEVSTQSCWVFFCTIQPIIFFLLHFVE